MKNVNDSLVTKYWQLLDPVVDVPVFRNKVIEDVALGENGYLLISPVTSTGDSTKHSHETQTSIQVGIYTRATSTNDGDLVETLADAIYDTIMPNIFPTNEIDLTGFHVRNIELESDFEQQPFIADQQTFLNRTITFRHMIFHKQDFS